MPDRSVQAESSYHTETGYRAIDAMTYHQQPRVDAYRHADTDVLLFRATNYGAAGTMTSASRAPEEPDLLFVSRGTGIAVHGMMAGGKFALDPTRAHRVTFMPQGVDSSVTFATAGLASNLMFPKGYLAGLIAEYQRSEFIPYLFQENATLIQLARLLEHEVANPGFSSRMIVEGLSRVIASLIARVNLEQVDHQADRIHLPPWKVRRLMDYVEGNLDQSISLDDLAKLADLSTFHFARVFKRATGISPYQYVRDRRLERGRALLTDTDMGIAELALACGFANQSHFTAAFSRAMGISPARFRQLARP